MLVDAPTSTYTIGTDLLVEPLQGSRQIAYFLRAFPEEIYHLSNSSHLYKFLSVILGENGVNWIRRNYLQARVALEELGIQGFDLDSFYANPFSFGRILEEVPSQDADILGSADQEKISAQDSQYRSRAIQFVNAARAGTTPLGMLLAARSALGHDAEIVENYRYFFDGHSDEPIGVPWQGSTNSLSEFVVLPRQEVAQNITQRITLSLNSSLGTTGTFTLTYNSATTIPLASDIDPGTLQAEISAISQIPTSNIVVTGGPPSIPAFQNYSWDVTFYASLGDRDIPTLTVNPSLAHGATMSVEVLVGVVESPGFSIDISPRTKRYLESALDSIRPWTSIPTTSPSRGKTTRVPWSQIQSSTTFNQVIQYVTGSQYVQWPPTDAVHWIVPNVEVEAPTLVTDLQHHYQNFHNVSNIISYTSSGASDNPIDFSSAHANPSLHIGRYPQRDILLWPFLGIATPLDTFGADRALADRPNPMTVTSTQEIDGTLVPFVNRSYPLDYEILSGIPKVANNDLFWSSAARPSGAEYLEIDLGYEQAVNFLSFEIARKPINITIDFDVSGIYPERRWVPASLVDPFITSIFMGSDTNPWVPLQYLFWNNAGSMPFTRFIRIGFIRRENPFTKQPPLVPHAALYPSPQLFPTSFDAFSWSIEARNLRVGRNVA